MAACRASRRSCACVQTPASDGFGFTWLGDTSVPLRDHFHGVLSKRRHWQSFHITWTGMMVRQLHTRLPNRYFAEPRTRLGSQVEAEELDDGVPTAVWMPSEANQIFPTDLPAQDTFEVRVYDEERGSRLVAVIELVSPAKKDRPEHRRAFVLKCAGYLQEKVSLVVVDIVTERHQNLHSELLQLLGLKETFQWPEDMPLYAIAYRTTKQDDQWQLDIWNERLAIGAALPTVPLWLASNLAVPVELEPSYEETCGVLRIR